MIRQQARKFCQGPAQGLDVGLADYGLHFADKCRRARVPWGKPIFRRIILQQCRRLGVGQRPERVPPRWRAANRHPGRPFCGAVAV